MKSNNLLLGLAVATAIVGTAIPTYAGIYDPPVVGVTIHLVDKLTGEK